MRKITLVIANVHVLFLVHVFVLCSPVPAQPPFKPPLVFSDRFSFQYAAKFVCLQNIPGTSEQTDAVLPGGYRTDVNIHNPNKKRVKFRKKLALTSPPGGQQPGEVSSFIDEELGPDEALKVDCADTDDFEFPGGQPIHGVQGFLVIESARSLDVTAVYTAGGANFAASDQVQSIAVEQVRERKINP